MRKFDWKVFLLLGIIVSVAVGFLYGTGFLGGSSGEAGSREDPLLGTSYAESAISQKVDEMDDRIGKLEARIASLENEIAILTGEPVNPGASVTEPPSAGGSTTPPGSGGTGGGTVSQANIGKSASVTADVVNLRESASTSAAIKKKLAPTDTFTITKVDTEKGWYQVQLSDGTVGWVAGYLVKIK